MAVHAPHQDADQLELKSWFHDYIALDGNGLGADHLLIQTVESDELESDMVETHVRQLIPNTNVEGGFCYQCRHLLEHWPDLGNVDWDVAVGRPCQTDEIEAATRAGCRFCAFLLSRLKVEGVLDTFRRIERRIQLLNEKGTTSLSIQNWGLGQNRSQILWLNFPGKVATHCNSPGAQATKFESHILSPTANLWHDNIDQCEIARRWLGRCLASHENCRTSSQNDRPARLVAIGGDGVKVVSTTTWDTLPRYATLSYCWGREPFPVLTENNLKSFMSSIPFGSLPKTFQKAIQLARKWGLQYMWIDALCIIQHQEDNSDWKRESSLMRSVYGGSHVTLAACNATGVYEGDLDMTPYHSGGFCARVSSTEWCRVQNFLCNNAYEEVSTHTPLASRAWALQEKLLSPRTIYFGTKGLFWECRCQIASAFLPDGFTGSLVNARVLVRPENKAFYWSDVVRHYSGAKLSYDSDRLPALSGIARKQQEVTGDTYLAGMWKDRLITQLPWVLVSEKRERPRWRAPTWCWTAINGRVAYPPYWDHPSPEFVQKEYTRVLDVWTRASGPNLYGAVDGGALSVGCSALVHGELYGPPSEEKRRQDSPVYDHLLLDGAVKPFAVMLDCRPEESDAGTPDVYLLPLFRGHSGTAYSMPKKDDGNGDRSVNRDSDHSQWFTELVIHGLVLRRHGQVKGCFYRLGSFAFYQRPENIDGRFLWKEPRQYDEFLQILEEVGEKVAEAECARILSQPGDSEMRHVITIE